MRKPTLISLTYSGYYVASVSYYAFILAFFPLHCKSLGFSPFEISLLGATLTLAIVFGMPSILQLAHHIISPRRLLLYCMAIAILSSAAIFGTKTAATLLPFWFILNFVKRGGDSLVDAQALRDSASTIICFERVRLWGSLGFILATFSIGLMVDKFGLVAILPSGTVMLTLCLIAAMMLRSFLGPNPNKVDRPTPKDGEFASMSSFLVLLLAYALILASQSVVFSYLSLYLDALGWSATMISLAWNLGVVAEIIFFFFFARLESRFTLIQILRLSIVMSILRWTILATAHSMPMILFAQILHAFSFGGCYVSGLKLSHKFLPDHLKDRGQGMLISVGHGAGGFVGYILAGAGATLLSSYKEANLLFLGSVVFSLLALVVTRFMKEPAYITARSLGSDDPGLE